MPPARIDRFKASTALDGSRHVILRGRGRQHHVESFEAPLSVKTVVRGHALWRTDQHCFALQPGSFLIVNDRHAYSMDLELRDEGETFCIFFQRGAVEDIARTHTTSAEALLDHPGGLQPHSFMEASRPDAQVLRAIGQLRAQRSEQPAELEGSILGVGEALVESDRRLQHLARRVPAQKLSTRHELLRRLLRARDYIEGSLAAELTLDRVARAAALSPYHLHRAFRQTFGETLHQFLTRRRLETAAMLLGAADRSILEICTAVGFESPTSFTALFARRYGAPPSRFRQISQDSRGPRSRSPVRSEP